MEEVIITHTVITIILSLKRTKIIIQNIFFLTLTKCYINKILFSEKVNNNT